MSDRLLVSRPKIGGFAYFVRAGDTVDSITVAAETVVSPAAGKPDNNPVANWPSLGIIKAFQPRNEVQEDKYLKPKAGGGYLQVTESHVIAEYYDLDFEGMSDIAFELMFGISKITLGTAQVPGSVLDRKVQGWLKYQARKQTGSDLMLVDVWVEARLREIPSFAVEPTTSKIAFQLLGSTLDTINFPS